MLDPISAASLASTADQLAATATNIVINMHRYYQAVRDAPKRSKELRSEVSAINDLLDAVVDFINSPSAASGPNIPNSFTDSVTEMTATLDNMNKRVQPSKTEGLRRLKWPFSKEENERLLSKIERYKAILSATLQLKNA
jgi:Skp family chaperone for outer membrane proteins